MEISKNIFLYLFSLLICECIDDDVKDIFWCQSCSKFVFFLPSSVAYAIIDFLLSGCKFEIALISNIHVGTSGLCASRLDYVHMHEATYFRNFICFIKSHAVMWHPINVCQYSVGSLITWWKKYFPLLSCSPVLLCLVAFCMWCYEHCLCMVHQEVPNIGWFSRMFFSCLLLPFCTHVDLWASFIRPGAKFNIFGFWVQFQLLVHFVTDTCSFFVV